MKTKNVVKRLNIWAIIVTGILALPFLAKAPWTTSDFIFAGIVLFGCATVYELTTRRMKNKKHRIAVAMAVLLFLVMVQAWAAAGPVSEREIQNMDKMGPEDNDY